MAKSYDSSFQTYLSAQSAYLPLCCLITTTDGDQIGLTEFDQDLIIQGITYRAAIGVQGSDTEQNLEDSPNQITVRGFFANQGITEAGIGRGVYEGAKIFAFRVNPFDLPTSFDSPYQYQPLITGTLGRFELTDQGYSVQARGLQDGLSTRQGWVTQKNCRNQFGDSLCGINLGNYTDTLSIDAVQGPTEINHSTSVGSNFYTGGKITWLSGDNAGTTNVVTYSSGEVIRMLHRPLNDMQVGDTFTVERGCDKTYRTCKYTYSNQNNFNGEPGLPGQDNIAKSR